MIKLYSYIHKFQKWLPFFLLYIPFKLFSVIKDKKSNKEILLFGTGTGLYHDNTKYLFEYILNNKNYKQLFEVYWIATTKETYIALQEKGIPVIYRNSFLCAKLAAKANAYFLTSGLLDVFWFINKKTLLIQLWHGTPIKRIGFDTAVDTQRLLKAKKNFGNNYQFERYDYLIIEDNKYKSIFQSAFQISESKILGLGQARNIIFSKDSKYQSNTIRERLALQEFKHIVLYAPTFRDEKIDNMVLLRSLLSSETIDYLKSSNICLLVKLHPFVAANVEIKSFLETFKYSVKHIINIVDIQELLIISDAVITDISSLALDYLQYSSNLYRFFPDEEQYISIRGDFYESTYSELIKNSKKIESLEQIVFDTYNFDEYLKASVCQDILELIK